MHQRHGANPEKTEASHLVRFHTTAEIVPDAERLAIHNQRGSCGVVALPDPSSAIGQIAVVAARREEVTAIGDRRVDPLRDDVVLEGRLQRVADIVDDDVRTGFAERLDVLRHLRLSTKTSGEVQLSSWSYIMDDLEQRRPLVTSARLSRKHRYPGRQVARGLPVGKGPDTIRDHTDPDAIDAMDSAGRVRPMGNVTLGCVVFAGYREIHRSCPGGGG